MTAPTNPNSLAFPVTLKVTQRTQAPQPTLGPQPTPGPQPANKPNALAISRGDSTALALLGAMLLVLAVVMGVSMSAAASGSFRGVVRAVTGIFGEDPVLAEQQGNAKTLAGLEQRVDEVAVEVSGLASRAHLAGYHDAAVSDRFSTIETDIASLAAEIRALRAARPEPTAGVSRAQVDFLEATVVEVGGGVAGLRSSLDAFAEAYRKDIAELSQTHRKDIAELAETQRKDVATLAAGQRKDIADITTRLDRIEQTLAAREVTSSIRVSTPVRKKKVRTHRPVPSARGTNDLAPFQPVPNPMFPGPLVSSR